MTVAFGETTISRKQIQLWYKRFKEDWVDVNDYARPYLTSTSTTDENIKQVKKMILNNRRMTIREIANDVGLSIECLKREMCWAKTALVTFNGDLDLLTKLNTVPLIDFFE